MYDFCKKKITENKTCFDFLYKFWPNQFLLSEEFSEILSKIHSNKSTNQMHQSLRFIARRSNTAHTCFGHPLAHHQELINCSSRLWFTVGTW